MATHKNETCTITIDITSFGYTYLLQLADMLEFFEEDGDNETALDTLHDWITEEAPYFLDEARKNRDFPAIDFFETLVE